MTTTPGVPTPPTPDRDAFDGDPTGDEFAADEFAADGFAADGFDEGSLSTAAGAQRRLARRMLAGIGALLVAAIAIPVLVGLLHRPAPGVEYRYVIPHGTAERLAAGEVVQALPERIELRTQDTLIIENQDHDAFSVGGLVVGGSQTMTYNFSKPGSYGGTCELHATGSVDIVVV